jgi:transcriptional regulator with XRE-family HTH domain
VWIGAPGFAKADMNLTPDTPDQTLASVLRQLRHDRGSTQEDLAHDAGLTVTSLARIERGQTNPKWTTLRHIVGALNITLTELTTAVENVSM